LKPDEMSSESVRNQAIKTHSVSLGPNDLHAGPRNGGEVLLNLPVPTMGKVVIKRMSFSEADATPTGAVRVERSTGEDRSWR
jgi:hypothetical protein